MSNSNLLRSTALVVVNGDLCNGGAGGSGGGSIGGAGSRSVELVGGIRLETTTIKRNSFDQTSLFRALVNGNWRSKAAAANGICRNGKGPSLLV